MLTTSTHVCSMKIFDKIFAAQMSMVLQLLERLTVVEVEADLEGGDGLDHGYHDDNPV